MKISNAKIKRDTMRFLKRTPEYRDNLDMGKDENYEVHFILKKSGGSVLVDVCCLAVWEDEGFLFNPYSGKPVSNLYGRDFDYDDDLFGMLEEGYEIIDMSMDSHFCIWSSLEEWQGEEINFPVGLQRYLGYCKRNGVTLEKLQDAVSYNGMDVITLYNGNA